ncbi:ParB/RepB/Spo0J family partition protein [Patescibacteria group bacterium]|nr:MAG: ParB/RepB/Spo0J family partition protein [Patescibacteria group bacterium]
MSVKKGLGRGFESLIPMDLMDESFDPTSKQDEQVSELRQIKLSQIVADPDQPRKQFDVGALEELADSIREHGIVQPIVVVPKGEGYQVVAGERRYRAAKLINLEKIPALVRTLSDQHKLEISLIENLQRKDLNAMEAATAYAKLRDQFNLTFEQIGKRMGNKSVSAISNTIRLLSLPLAVRTALREGKVNEGQMKPFVGVKDDLVESILPRIIREGWTARFAEQYAANLRQSGIKDAKSAPGIVVESRFEPDMRRLSKHFQADIRIKTGMKGDGQIIIKFKDEKEFRRIEEMLEKE